MYGKVLSKHEARYITNRNAKTVSRRVFANINYISLGLPLEKDDWLVNPDAVYRDINGKHQHTWYLDEIIPEKKAPMTKNVRES